MPTEPAHLCSNCRHWNHIADAGDDDAEEYGECRRHAPLPMLCEAVDALSKRIVWPITDDLDWCGLWEPRPREQPTGQHQPPTRETP